jgi:hypothetical protein
VGNCIVVLSLSFLGIGCEIDCSRNAWVTARYAKPSDFVLQGVSLQPVAVRSRRAKLVFHNFVFYFCSKMVLVVTLGKYRGRIALILM